MGKTGKLGNVIKVLVLMLGVIWRGNAATCNYDCDAYHPSMFGKNNLNAGLAGFPLAKSKAFAPISMVQVCKSASTKLTGFMQPQVETLRRNQFYVLCPQDKTINLVRTFADKEASAAFDSFEGSQGIEDVMQIEKVIKVDAQGMIQGFVVNRGYLAVSAENSVHLYQTGINQLTHLWDASLPEEVSGLPIISRSFIGLFGDTHVLKVPIEYAKNPAEIAVLDVKAKNTLGYGLADKDEAIFFCTEKGITKVLADGQISVLDLAGNQMRCTSVILPFTGKLIYTAESTNKIIPGSQLVEIDSDLTSSNIEQLGHFKGNVYAIARAGYNLNNKPVSLIAMTTSEGIELIVDRIAGETRGESLLLSPIKEAGDVIGNPVALDNEGEPAFDTTENVIAMENNNELRFYELERVFGPQVGGTARFSTNPVLVSGTSIASVTEDGRAVLYTYCRKYLAGDNKPDVRACPFPDLPNSDGLSPALIVLASASTAVCFPAGIYLWRKAKWSSKRKEDKLHRIVLGGETR